MKKIDFFCVGTQKGGTTTLHDILIQHPDLCLPEKKETHFFSNVNFRSNLKDLYFNNFKNLDSYKFFGEVDPEYSFFSESAKRIYETFGKTKIIFIIRNPVERAFSHYLMTKRRGLEDLTFEKALKVEKERIKTEYGAMHYSYLSRGYYLKQILTFEEFFGAENVKIILFEEFINNTNKIVNEISDFIGLPPFNYYTNKMSNPASSPRFGVVQKFIYKKSKFKNIIGQLIKSKDIKRKIMQSIETLNLKKSKKDKLSIECKKSIYLMYFAKEIEALEKKLNINLSDWKN